MVLVLDDLAAIVELSLGISDKAEAQLVFEICSKTGA